MNAVSTAATPSINIEAEFFGLDRHLLKTKVLIHSVEDAWEQLLAHVELHTDAARQAGDQVDVLLGLAVGMATATAELSVELQDRLENYPTFTASVAQHVDIRQRHDWIEAVEAYRAAETSPECTNEACDATAAAFQRMVNTRAPNLRCLHEKVTAIDSTCAWNTGFVVDAIMTDIEALIRKYEIAAKASDGGEG